MKYFNEKIKRIQTIEQASLTYFSYGCSYFYEILILTGFVKETLCNLDTLFVIVAENKNVVLYM